MEASTLKSFVVKALANTVLQGGPVLPRYTQDIHGDISGTKEVNIWHYEPPAAETAEPQEYVVITIPYASFGAGNGMDSRLPKARGAAGSTGNVVSDWKQFGSHLRY